MKHFTEQQQRAKFWIKIMLAEFYKKSLIIESYYNLF